jgi:hypothetical protein
MTFDLDETQGLVRRAAADFARRELAPRASERDRLGTFPAAELEALGALGLLGVNVPEALGGAGAGPVALAAALVELAAADASVAVTVAVTNMVAEVLARFGRGRARDWLVRRLVDGEAGSFALSEAQAGSDAAAISTRARATPGGYVLSGSKLWITSGDHAGAYVVVAKHDEPARADRPRPRISAFAIPAGTPGLRADPHERKLGQRGSSTVPLVLDDVFVPEEQLLGAEGDGLKVAFAALDGGRVAVAAMAVGVGRAAHAAACAYARQRQQFGRPIGEFQAIGGMLADGAIGLEAAWLLTLAAAGAKASGDPRLTRLSAEAKTFASEKALAVCDQAIQIHGGYGYTRDFPVERFFRDVRVMPIYEGTNQIQRLVIAREILRHADVDSR